MGVASYLLLFLILFYPSAADAATALSSSDSLPRRALLGVTVEPTPDNHVRIAKIVPGSAAERSELAVGDILLALNGSAIDSVATFLATMKSFKSAVHITCRVQREWERSEYRRERRRMASGAAGRHSGALRRR